MDAPASVELESTASLYAATYDSVPIHWDGELDTYLGWARDAAHSAAPRILELACGTGRLAIPMADAGCEVWGVDLSPAFLAIAERKRPGTNPRWIEGDMRTVRLDVEVDFSVIPAQSFGFMLTAEDQVAALRTLRWHLRRGGRLAVHAELMEPAFLAQLPTEAAPVGEVPLERSLTDRDGTVWQTGASVSFDRLAEVVTFRLEYARMDGDRVLERRHEAPMGFKALGVVEVEHALRRAGCTIVDRIEWAGTTSTPGARQLVWLAESED